MTDAREAGLGVLGKIAVPQVTERALELEAAGTHLWIWDPEHEHVVGLVERTRSSRAVVVVYLVDDDFEMDEQIMA